MKLLYISSEERTRKNLYISSLSSFLSKDEKVLIINMDDNRELEILFKVEDYIIYDNLDYFSKMSDLEQSITEIEDNLDILPSAFKPDKYSIEEEDYKSINNIEGYDYIILNIDKEYVKLLNQVDIITDKVEDYETFNKYFINNRYTNKKINKKRKEELEKNGFIVIGDQLIDKNTKNEELNTIWKVYTGSSDYNMDRNIIERILNL